MHGVSNIKHNIQNAIPPPIAKFLHIPHKEQHAPTNGWLSLKKNKSIFMVETVHKIYILVTWFYSYLWQAVHMRRWCTELGPKPLEGRNKWLISSISIIIIIILIIIHKLQNV
jgi:hypothetical protein